MKTSQVTDEMLSRMSPEERAKLLGAQTAEEAQAKFAARSEGELQKQIANYCRLKGIWFYQSRFNKAHTGMPGTPDFLMCGYALEVKHGKGKLSEDQIKCHDAMRKSGWCITTVDTYNDAIAFIQTAESLIKPI